MTNLFKTIATSALTGLSAIGVASASIATTQGIVEGSIEAHEVLVEEIRRNGVTIKINDEDGCSEEGLNGFYSGQKKLLIVCQDNGVAGGPVVAWTANDLDTLRHEAQHFIQDCRVGSNHDHALAPVYHSPSALAQEVLGPERVFDITTRYRENGASDLVLLLEYEAFAVAARNIPGDQASDLVKLCSGGK